MATIGTATHASFTNSPRRLYIATAPFDTYFYSYNGEELSCSVEGASCATCPIGRILRETGRKLYPGANPGVTRYMVGVYDSVTFLNGFINPNDNVFAVYNSDKPTYISNDVESSDEETEGSVDNYGAPVLTQGNVISSDGFVGIQSTISDGALYAGSYLYTGNYYNTPPHPFLPEGIPIVEAGTNYPNECTSTNLSTLTYATLYPDGTIQSIRWTNDEPIPFPSTAFLTADGDIFNTGNTSTIGDVYIGGTLSTIGTSALVGGVAVGDGGSLFAKITKGVATVTSVTSGASSNATPYAASFGFKPSVTLTVPEAVSGDTLILNQGGDIPQYIMAGYYITGANAATVQLMCHNTYGSNGSVTVPNFRYTLLHPA